MTEHNKRFKLCIKWFQQVDENHVIEKQKLQSALESTEKKCSDIGNQSVIHFHVYAIVPDKTSFMIRISQFINLLRQF